MTARARSRWCCRRAFPNLLANGAAGIAVGMATSIPPHNIGELCDALAHLIAQAGAATVGELIALRARPGFPDRRRAGRAAEQRSAEAYETGRGSFRLRARWIKEPLAHGLYQIVVTEIPYQVQKSRLIERIAAAAGRAQAAAAWPTSAMN